MCFGWALPYLKDGISDFNEKGARFGISMECGMSKISIGISTGLPENLGRDAGLKNPIGNPRNKHQFTH